MTHPDFAFDKKTGELRRGGKIVPLCKLHAEIFVMHQDGDVLSTKDVADRLHIPFHDTQYAISCVQKRLRKIGLDLAGVSGRGRRFVVNDMPKWQPTIPPPITIEGDR